MDRDPKLSSIPIPPLPNDVTDMILNKLPLKSLIRSQSVCKEWCSLIENNYRRRRKVLTIGFQQHLYEYCYHILYFFMTILFHLSPLLGNISLFSQPECLSIVVLLGLRYFSTHRRLRFISVGHDGHVSSHVTSFWHVREPSDFKYDRYRVRSLGSCNGLVFITCDSSIYMTNPGTRSVAKVLELGILKHITRNKNNMVSGICHDKSTGDYKVVLIVRNGTLGLEKGGFVIVGSCKSKEWREVSFPHNHRTSARHNIEFRGMLHFVVLVEGVARIVYFDPKYDMFKTLPPPQEDKIVCGLGVIDDCLCMGRIKFIRGIKVTEVLVMKEYGVKESWVTAFSIQTICFFKEVQIYSTENQRKLMLIYDGVFRGMPIFIDEYDRETDEYKTLREQLRTEEIFEVEGQAYVESVDNFPQELVWRRGNQLRLRLTPQIQWLQPSSAMI